jgi:hypothetical protein
MLAYDCLEHEEILLQHIYLFLSGDGPMQAEASSQAGTNTTLWCRRCMSGGSKRHRISDEGYLSLMMMSKPRSVTTTIYAILEQVAMALEEGSRNRQRQLIRESGVKDSLASIVIDQILSATEKFRLSESLLAVEEEKVMTSKEDKQRNKEAASKRSSEFKKKMEAEVDRHGCELINPLLLCPGSYNGASQCFLLILNTGLNVHKDTPVEILHTILLGIIKYFWGQTVYYFTNTLKGKEASAAFEKLRARLHSISQDGLNIPKIAVDYICNYKGALIGKHLKALGQVMPFALLGLAPESLIKGWQAVGCVMVLVWYTSISDMDGYEVRKFCSVD